MLRDIYVILCGVWGKKMPLLSISNSENPLLCCSHWAGEGWRSPPPAGAAPRLCEPTGSGSASVALLAPELPHVWIPDKCLNTIVSC